MRKPKVGDFIKPDNWTVREPLLEDKMGIFPYRVQTLRMKQAGLEPACYVVLTGKKQYNDGSFRCQIVFPSGYDDQPDEIAKGKVWLV